MFVLYKHNVYNLYFFYVWESVHLLRTWTINFKQVRNQQEVLCCKSEQDEGTFVAFD